MKSLIRTISKGLSWVGDKVAMVVTPIVLTLFYFTVFAIASLVAKLSGADLLHRRAKNPSYWSEPSKVERDERHYRAQF